MRAIYDTQLSSITPVASTENPNFPVVNILDNSIDKSFRTTDVNAESVVFDAGAGNTFTCDSVAIIGHNFTSGATIKFQMHTADAWGAPDVDETLTWREDLIIKYFTSASKRYIRLYIDDAANTDGYLEVGRIIADSYLQFDPSSNFGFRIGNESTDDTIFTQGNVMFSNQGVQYRTFDYSFPKTSYTMIAKVRTLFENVGNFKSFVFSNYDTDYGEIAPAYVSLIGGVTESWQPHQKAEYSIRMRECR